MIKLKSPKDITSKHKFLLIIFQKTEYHFEGDERSRTNPGHGYPAHDEIIDSTETYVFTEQAGLEAELIKLYEEKRNRQDLLVIDISRAFEPKASIKVDLN